MLESASKRKSHDSLRACLRTRWSTAARGFGGGRGANSGIGQAVALALASAGADVVVNYVSRPEAAEAVVREASRRGADVYAHQADVRKEAEVRDMFKRMIQEFGTIDILVNNAGLQKDARIEDMTLYPGFETGG